MTQPTYGPHNRPVDPHDGNPQPPSLQQMEEVWANKYDEQINRHETDITRHPTPMQKIYQRLNTTPEKLSEFCQKWQIVELALFGSVLRDDFRSNGNDPSDVDVLYVHLPTVTYGFEIFDMKEELESLFTRKVDFVSKKAIQNSRNWLRRKSILESAQVIYAKRSAITH